MNSMNEGDSTSVKFITILSRFHNNAMNKLNFRLNYSIKPLQGSRRTTLCIRSTYLILLHQFNVTELYLYFVITISHRLNL
jgi:hypothetical protein